MARGNEFAFSAHERPIIDRKLHLQRGRIDLRERQGMAGFVGGERIANINIFKTGETNDITRAGGRILFGAEAGELENFGDFGANAFSAFRVTEDVNRIANIYGAAENLTHRNTTNIVTPIDVGDQHMEGIIGFGEGRGNVVENGLEEGSHVLLFFTEMIHHVTIAA